MELSNDAKNALLDCFRHSAYATNDAQTFFDALQNAFFPLTSISAVYTQSGIVYDTDDLDVLKVNLVVTANYEDGTTQTVTTYTLSGTLAAGTSTITVEYSGKTTTFDVTVTHNSTVMLYSWDFTQSLTDSIQGVTATIDSSVYQKPTRDSMGVHITNSSSYIDLGQIYDTGITVEIDFGTMDRQGTGNGRVLSVGNQATSGLSTGFIYRNNNTWNWYANSSWCTAVTSTTNPNYFSNKTLKAVFDSSGYMSVYDGTTLLGTSSRPFATSVGTYMQIGSYCGTGSYSCFYNMTVLAVRIYREG